MRRYVDGKSVIQVSVADAQVQRPIDYFSSTLFKWMQAVQNQHSTSRASMNVTSFLFFWESSANRPASTDGE